MHARPTFTAFRADRLIATGSGQAVAAAVRATGGADGVLVFDNTSGALIDFDLLDQATASTETSAAAPRGRGRPKLGVVAREVTLLPRHWDWLASQPGGASVVLRKLVEEASRDPRTRARAAATAAYNFLHAIAGDRPGYEEVLRAVFSHDFARFTALTEAWPTDIRDHALRLGFPEERP